THGIEPFDLVVVNLYPFAATVARGASFEDSIEQIDIGGPAMVRAAAKNFESVGVVTDPASYGAILEEIRRLGGLSRETRLGLARRAFSHTAAYDDAISTWLSGEAAQGSDDELPSEVGLEFRRVASLRY